MTKNQDTTESLDLFARSRAAKFGLLVDVNGFGGLRVHRPGEEDGYRGQWYANVHEALLAYELGAL